MVGTRTWISVFLPGQNPACSMFSISSTAGVEKDPLQWFILYNTLREGKLIGR